jgi:hypothetical protein
LKIKINQLDLIRKAIKLKHRLKFLFSHIVTNREIKNSLIQKVALNLASKALLTLSFFASQGAKISLNLHEGNAA